MSLALLKVSSPLGPLLVAVTEEGALCGLGFADRQGALRGYLDREFAGAAPSVEPCHLKAAVRCLESYFAGDLEAFGALPVELRGTSFQQAVWQRLALIPAGSVMTYGELALAIDRPGACRAVGGACHANPVTIAVPCHRVVGAGGALTGYGGGLARKRWLLQHEAAAGAAASARRRREG
jgi:methylated-DNA-[protein]-cysteine S-methyltransferase